MANDLASLSESPAGWLIYEGLPDKGLTDEFKTESSGNMTVTIDGESFYDTPIPLTKQDVEALQGVLSDLESYEESFSGDKLCGGFHADWAISVPTKKGSLCILLCFGCRDFRVVDDKQAIRFGMARRVGDRLESILSNLHKNLPESLRR